MATSAFTHPTKTPDIPLAEQAFRTLRTAIVRCEYEPGQRLRVEELSKRYNVSSSPVREALSRLVEHGLVCAFEHRGFHVAPVTVAGIRDLTRMRLLLEREALGDAMAHGTEAWEADLVAAAYRLGRVEERLDSGPVALDDDWSMRHREFHLAMYSATPSPLLLTLVEALFDSAERYRRYSARFRQTPRNKHDHHQRLLDAVLARNISTADALLADHIQSTCDSVVRSLKALPQAYS